MPLYEYQCIPNRHRFEVRHGISEDPIKTCPECGADVRRVIHPVGVVFKGTGFYVTDSRKSNAASKPAESSASSDSKSTDSKPSESKSSDASGSAGTSKSESTAAS